MKNRTKFIKNLNYFLNLFKFKEVIAVFILPYLAITLPLLHVYTRAQAEINKKKVACSQARHVGLPAILLLLGPPRQDDVTPPGRDPRPVTPSPQVNSLSHRHRLPSSRALSPPPRASVTHTDSTAPRWLWDFDLHLLLSSVCLLGLSTGAHAPHASSADPFGWVREPLKTMLPINTWLIKYWFKNLKYELI